MTGSPPRRSAYVGAGGDRRPGIATDRLEQDVGLGADHRKLFGDKKPVLAVGHDDRATKQRRIGHAANGVLECRQRTKQRQELLRPCFRATTATAGSRRRRT